MKVLKSRQIAEVSDAVRSKFAMTVPVLEATLNSLKRERIERYSTNPERIERFAEGLRSITLADLSREFREGSGDAGICFEYAIHDAIAHDSPLIEPLASEVLEEFCNIQGGAWSILFGPEKDGVIPILESAEDALTEDARVYVGNRGQPPKLRQYIPQIINAFRRHEERNKLPRSINGLWKADLFLGNGDVERWVGTTVKINPSDLQGAQGLRIGIYPQVDRKDRPRKDDSLNLIRLPLPYDAAFMELFYKAFFLTRAFMNADARCPPPVKLPDAEDRFVTNELEIRRSFPVVEVLDVLREMGQRNLLENDDIIEIGADATLSQRGLDSDPKRAVSADFVSLAPGTREVP